MTRTADALSIALGVAGAVATDGAAQRLGHRRRAIALGLELALVAAVYPAGRIGWRERGPVVRELAGVIGYSAVAAIGMARVNTDGHRIIGVAWMTHAVFDAVHHRGYHSRLPSWYPAVCAGYDVALGALLSRSRHSASRVGQTPHSMLSHVGYRMETPTPLNRVCAAVRSAQRGSSVAAAASGA